MTSVESLVADKAHLRAIAPGVHAFIGERGDSNAGAIETPMLRENFSEKAIPTDNTLDPMDVAAAIFNCLSGKTDMQPGETRKMPSH